MYRRLQLANYECFLINVNDAPFKTMNMCVIAYYEKEFQCPNRHKLLQQHTFSS